MISLRGWGVHALVFASGTAGLTWELIWQHHASLALGVSALGTAITLICTMAGMAVGALLMGRWMSRHTISRPLRAYAVLELIIGLGGLAIAPGFGLLSQLDSMVWRASPAVAPPLQFLGIALLLGPQVLAMGATIPIFRLLAERHRSTLSGLYGLNTAGAAAGILMAAMALVPALGITMTSILAACINLMVAALAWLGSRRPVEEYSAEIAEHKIIDAIGSRLAIIVVLFTGFSTFALEVAWFRSLRAAFQSTTDSFAIILASVLIPLALGARIARMLPRKKGVVEILLALAAVSVLLATPIVERFDLFLPLQGGYWTLFALRFAISLAVIGLPMLALGTVLPWILDGKTDPLVIGRLYAVNTGGAVLGALGAAWVLLPAMGFTHTAWLVGAVLGCVALLAGPHPILHKRRILIALVITGAFLGAYFGESGVGRLRVQGSHLKAHRVLASRDGPDSTISVLMHNDGSRELVIDGFQTSGEARNGHYMIWMGRLPMLLHPNPRRALVICFGTGQTANAVRRERPEHLDIIELSPAVLKLAPLFPSNESVLSDHRVKSHRMDGRAWLRRVKVQYDVITLEPMAPHFAGTNALYSREFYDLAANRLVAGGIIAQWLPLHLVTPREVAAIVSTFMALFPFSGLWIDPVDRTGILVGRKEKANARSWLWPGLARRIGGRDLSPRQIKEALIMGSAELARLAAVGKMITDDNQLLAYGAGRKRIRRFGSNKAVHRVNLDIIYRLAGGS